MPALHPALLAPRVASRWPYAFDWRSAFRALLVASAGITLWCLIVPPLLGLEVMDHGIVVGGMIFPEGGPAAYLVRAFWHLVNGWVFSLVYMGILLLLQKQSTAWRGAIFGAGLWLIGPMTILPCLLDLDPQVRSGVLHNPGVFMLPLGHGLLPAAVDLAAHLIHGTLGGLVYKQRLRYPGAGTPERAAAAKEAALTAVGE
jgi:hypothetical protein